MSNEWTRRQDLEDAFYEMHNIKPEIYKRWDGNEQYQIKIINGSKTAILTEGLKNGLTKFARLDCGTHQSFYKKYFDAENVAVSMIK